MTLQHLEQEISGLINGAVPVHIKSDATKTKKKDCLTQVKTYQSQFYTPTGAYLPELILTHTTQRKYARVKCNGSAFVAAPVPSQPAVPASTVAVQNTNTYPVIVVISGGSGLTAVVVNGITVGTGDGTYIVPAAGTISITYSVTAPTWVWSNANSASGNSQVYLCMSLADAQQQNPQPQGFAMQPGDIYETYGSTELWLVAFGSGTAPTVSVSQDMEQQ